MELLKPLRDGNLREEGRRTLLLDVERELCERGLADFHRDAWPHIDPAQYIHNWSTDAVAEHLEAVAYGFITRLIVTLPPRMMKSLLAAVTFPAWVWAQARVAPLSGPQVKFITASYNPDFAVRDSLKMHRLLDSRWFRDRWGDRFHIRPDRDQARMFENSAGGFRFSTAVEGAITGEGADILMIDDPANAQRGMWESARNRVNDWWDNAVPTRLNDQTTGAKIIIMQRLHEDDLVGHVLSKELEDWTHLNLPMEFDPDLDTRTWVKGFSETEPFFEDPRTEPGELLWPSRFPRAAVDRLKIELGPFSSSAQLQQQPTPRGGGIILREWWQAWDTETAALFGVNCARGLQFPPMEFILVSLDTTFGKKEENDWNAATVWGLFHDQRERPKVMLMEAWRNHLPLLGVKPPDQIGRFWEVAGEPDPFAAERRKCWGLTEHTIDTARRRHADAIVIENKSRGSDLADEIRKLLKPAEMSLYLVDPVSDKSSRLASVQPFFADELIYAPVEKQWCSNVITEVTQFPKAKHDDFTDTVGQALALFRKLGLIQLGNEADQTREDKFRFRRAPQMPYDV